MAMQHLPRPWMLAALADVPVTLLAQRIARDTESEQQEDAPPRPDARRRRLGGRPLARPWSEPWHGEDGWGGAERWRDVELGRAA